LGWQGEEDDSLALMVLYPKNAVLDLGLYFVPGHAGVRGNETADKLVIFGYFLEFMGPEPDLGVSRQDLRNKFSRWLGNQHWRCW
jgi:hypothetical protein